MTASPIPAAVAYFAVAFAAGFVLGTIRVLVLAPALGELPAVLIELPIMLAISALAAARIVPRFRVSGRTADRLTMGLVAFLFLMVAESLLAGAIGPGDFASEALGFFASFDQPAKAAGLAGQILFALIPLVIPPRSAS